MSKKLLKSGALISFYTLISRVLGLVRDVFIAKMLGASSGADVFFFANKIPNFLRKIFAEGAFSQAFVPVLSQSFAVQNQDQTKKLIAKVTGTLGIVVFFTTLAGVFLSPIVVILFAFGWFLEFLGQGDLAYKFNLASLMLKITFPYLFFITLAGVFGAVLNTIGKFSVSAFSPIILNISIILSSIYLSSFFEYRELSLAIGVFIGGFLQLLFSIPFVIKEKLIAKPIIDFRDKQIKKIIKLMIPALFGVSVSQINLMLDTLLASFLKTGSISWLYYSDRLLEFPLGVFAIAIATIILPSLAKDHIKKDQEKYKKTLLFAVKLVVFLGVPATAGLIVLAKPMILVLFMHGEFTLNDTFMASYSLIAYAFGLLFFMLIKILAPAYYSILDTKTPVKIGIIALVANMVFNLCLVFPFGYVGLALATSLSAFLNFFLLCIGLIKRKLLVFNTDFYIFFAKIVFAALLMSFVVFYNIEDIRLWAEKTSFTNIFTLVKLIFLGLFSYVFTLFILRVKPKDLLAKF